MKKRDAETDNVVHLEIPDVPIDTLIVTVGGEAMLQNRLSDGEREKIKGKKKAGDKEDYTTKSSRWKQTGHYTADEKLGFPAEAFLKAMGSAMKGIDLSHKKDIKHPKDLYRAAHIESDDFDQDGNGVVVYAEGKPEMNEHWGILRGTTPIPIYRTLVKNWQMNLRIVYNSALLTAHDILLLLSRAGIGVGVGAFRAEVRGPYGRFQVVSAVEKTKKRLAA